MQTRDKAFLAIFIVLILMSFSGITFFKKNTALMDESARSEIKPLPFDGKKEQIPVNESADTPTFELESTTPSSSSKAEASVFFKTNVGATTTTNNAISQGRTTQCYDSSFWYTLRPVPIATSTSGLEHVYRAKPEHNALIVRFIPFWKGEISDAGHMRQISLVTKTSLHPLGSKIIVVWKYSADASVSGEMVSVVIPMDQFINEDGIKEIDIEGVENIPCSLKQSLRVEFVSITPVSVQSQADAVVYDELTGGTGKEWELVRLFSSEKVGDHAQNAKAFVAKVPYTPSSERALRICIRPTSDTYGVSALVYGAEDRELLKINIGEKFSAPINFDAAHDLCHTVAFSQQTSVEQVERIRLAIKGVDNVPLDGVLRSIAFVEIPDETMIFDKGETSDWWYLHLASYIESEESIALRISGTTQVLWKGCRPCFIRGLDVRNASLVLVLAEKHTGTKLRITTKYDDKIIQEESVSFTENTLRIPLKNELLTELLLSNAGLPVDLVGIRIEMN